MPSCLPHHSRPGATLAPHPVAASPVSLFCPTSPPRSFEVGSEGLGQGRGCSARPRPTPRAFAPGAGHDCLPPGCGPHGADPPVASRRAVRRDGWWLPAAGPLACPLPPAAGPGPVCLGRSSVVRCSGPAVRSPVTSPCPPSLGACSQPCFPTRAAAVLSGSLALSPPYLCCVPCPLGTTLPFRAPSLCPWWSGEKGAWGTRRGPRWLRGEVVGGGCGRMGGDFFLIKSLIKKFIPSIYSVLKHHTYCTGSPWKGPPLSRTATDSTMKGQQGALLPSFLPWRPPGFKIYAPY